MKKMKKQKLMKRDLSQISEDYDRHMTHLPAIEDHLKHKYASATSYD